MIKSLEGDISFFFFFLIQPLWTQTIPSVEFFFVQLAGSHSREIPCYWISAVPLQEFRMQIYCVGVLDSCKSVWTVQSTIMETAVWNVISWTQKKYQSHWSTLVLRWCLRTYRVNFLSRLTFIQARSLGTSKVQKIPFNVSFSYLKTCTSK